MFRPDAESLDYFRHVLRRRDFLHAGALAGLGTRASNARGAIPSNDVNCIMINLVGGPSHLDTWDMKPNAPSHIRGPYRPIKTNVPGIEISEIFPNVAKHADKYAIIRSVYHTASSHESARHAIGMNQLPGTVLLPNPNLRPASDLASQRYGLTRFGQSCLQARCLIESGVRYVTINMFQTVFNSITWDIHGFKPFSPMGSYRDHLGPIFDRAYASLLDDLHQRGLLSSTIVIAMGEFGRTPKINMAGGRDHWPHCFSILMAGGPIRGGQIIGSSDEIGAYPRDLPVTPADVAATAYYGLGLTPDPELDQEPGRPIKSLFM